MKHLSLAGAAVALLSSPLALLAAPPAPVYNANLTSIYGLGNPDTGWATDTFGNIQLGLQLKNGIPGDTTNTNGVYSLALGTIENLDFSINTNLLGTGQTLALAPYTFTLSGINVNTSASLFSFNPNAEFSDSTFGTNATGDSSGTVGTFAAESGTNNIEQNSEKLSFGFMGGVNINVPGTYLYTLTATNSDHEVLAQVSVEAVFGSGGAAVPDRASSAVLLGVGLLGLVVVYRVRRKSTKSEI